MSGLGDPLPLPRSHVASVTPSLKEEGTGFCRCAVSHTSGGITHMQSRKMAPPGLGGARPAQLPMAALRPLLLLLLLGREEVFGEGTGVTNMWPGLTSD